jgi:hypothetical protein
MARTIRDFKSFALQAVEKQQQRLLTKIEQTKKSQDSVTVTAEQIKKVVELHKERQKKVMFMKDFQQRFNYRRWSYFFCNES